MKQINIGAVFCEFFKVLLYEQNCLYCIYSVLRCNIFTLVLTGFTACCWQLLSRVRYVGNIIPTKNAKPEIPISCHVRVVQSAE